jgi:hypothetical protein
VDLGTRPTYGVNSALVYNSNYNLTTAEWDQNVSSGAGVPYNVTINGGNSVSYNGSTYFRQVRGNFTNYGTFTLGGSGGGFKVAGDFDGNGTFTPNSREVEFNGSGAQTINSATTWDYLAINNGSGVTLAANQTVNTRLRFANGLLKLSSYDLTLGPSAEAVSGSPDASKMVVTDGSGALCKRFGTISGYTYPIGDATGTAEYSPVTAVTVSGTPSGSPSVCFRVTDAQSPNLPNNLTTYITRYWTGTMNGSINSLSYDATFNFVEADKVGSDGMNGKKWNGSFPWIELDAVSGLTFLANDQISFSDFTAFKSGVLAVTLAEFFAQQVSDHVLVTWETASELGNLGFNLYRGVSPAGPDRRLNDLLIPSQSVGNPGGFVYTWDDHADLVPGTTYYYWVEDVDINGAATRHGPVSVDFVAPTAVTVGRVQASPVAPAALPLVGTLLALLTPLAAAGLRRRA